MQEIAGVITLAPAMEIAEPISNPHAAAEPDQYLINGASNYQWFGSLSKDMKYIELKETFYLKNKYPKVTVS